MHIDDSDHYLRTFEDLLYDSVYLLYFSFDTNQDNYKDYVIQNKKFLRPEELPYLKGDSTKIRKLGWECEYTFESMMDEMIEHWVKIYN